MTVIRDVTWLIDAGNTRLKWGVLTQGGVSQSGALRHSCDDLDQRLRDHWDDAKIRQAGHLTTLIIANVGGTRLVESILAYCTHYQLEPQMTLVQPEAEAYGVHNAYAEPHKLGVDRWVSLIAAHHQVSGAACLVDCGTAITIDIINSQGKHQGGVILPGLSAMRQSLKAETLIPAEDFKNDSSISSSRGFLGQDTHSAIQGGVFAAASGAIGTVMAAAQKQLTEPLTPIITGGDAPQLLAYLPLDYRHEPDWILRGLQVIAEART